MHGLVQYLARHAFEELFIERLGWDCASGTHLLAVDGCEFQLNVIAHKRGFQVLHGVVDRFAIINRRLLRRVQRAATRLVHEHILIYSSEAPRRQVWQWAVHLPNGRQLRHREHAFFSEAPPPKLLKRLAELEFRLDEEEHLSLLDALDRVRRVLDTSAELNLFVKRPALAQKSHQLFKACQAGNPDAKQQFVLLHQPLVNRVARRLHRYHIDREDAQQIGNIGLLQAMKRYQPERGYQFSTYATWWIRHACHRYGVELSFTIRVPTHVLWLCLRLRYTYNELITAHGPYQGRVLFERILADTLDVRYWEHFRKAVSVRSLSDPGCQEYRAARQLTDPAEGPLTRAIRSELAQTVRTAISRLHPRYAQVIRLRYGIDGPPLTLEQIGRVFGVTRERVRQLQVKAEEKLYCAILSEMPSLREEIVEPNDPPQGETQKRPAPITATCLAQP